MSLTIPNKNGNYIAKSNIPNGGKGLFAGKDYKKGETIDINPFIEVDANAVSISILKYYSWSSPWGVNPLVTFGSINYINELNDKEKMNTNIFHFDYIHKNIKASATKDIKKGEEFITNYGPNYNRTHY